MQPRKHLGVLRRSAKIVIRTDHRHARRMRLLCNARKSRFADAQFHIQRVAQPLSG